MVKIRDLEREYGSYYTIVDGAIYPKKHKGHQVKILDHKSALSLDHYGSTLVECECGEQYWVSDQFLETENRRLPINNFSLKFYCYHCDGIREAITVYFDTSHEEPEWRFKCKKCKRITRHDFGHDAHYLEDEEDEDL